jgi:hypothetical protein
MVWLASTVTAPIRRIAAGKSANRSRRALIGSGALERFPFASVHGTRSNRLVKDVFSQSR